MNIGYDAKRLFNNISGLGNYSRTMLMLLAKYYPQNIYQLFTPYRVEKTDFSITKSMIINEPQGLWKLGMMSSWWQNYSVPQLLIPKNIRLFHGLTNELPAGIADTHIQTVVTIHDLIFLSHPQFYTSIDRAYLSKKARNSIENADHIIAVSEKTRNEIMDYFKVPMSNITVVYQTCNEQFFSKVSKSDQQLIRKKYNLPKNFLLTVGTIEKRKNLLNLIIAIYRHNIDLPLVVVGQPTPYLFEIQKYISDNNLQEKIIFVHKAKNFEMPAIYQMASLFIYISVVEGFGIPVLEAMASGIPVVTTKGTTMEESGREAFVYVEHDKTDEIANAIKTILESEQEQQKRVALGDIELQRFTGQAVAQSLYQTYQKLM